MQHHIGYNVRPQLQPQPLQMPPQQQQNMMPLQQPQQTTAPIRSNYARQPQQQQPMITQLPQLRLISQNALEREVLSLNGMPKEVHAVVKNMSFALEIGATVPGVNFAAVTLEAILLYDGPEDKLVDYVKAPPLTYQCKVKEGGESVIVEAILTVLSSQHEDSLFRIKFFVNGTPLQLYSKPIRVVSKPAQLRRKKEVNCVRKVTASSNKKRPYADFSLKDAIDRMERSQREHSKALNSLCEAMTRQNQILESHQPPHKKQKLMKPKEEPKDIEETDIAVPMSTKGSEVPQAEPQLPQQQPQQQQPTNKIATEDFERHLIGLVDTYHAIPEQCRVEVVRKALRNSPAGSMHRLSEVIDCLSLEGLRREMSTSTDASIMQDLGTSLTNSGDADLYKFCENFLSPMLQDERDKPNGDSNNIIPLLRRGDSGNNLLGRFGSSSNLAQSAQANTDSESNPSQSNKLTKWDTINSPQSPTHPISAMTSGINSTSTSQPMSTSLSSGLPASAFSILPPRPERQS